VNKYFEYKKYNFIEQGNKFNNNSVNVVASTDQPKKTAEPEAETTNELLTSNKSEETS
jgi:hypothetical protein